MRTLAVLKDEPEEVDVNMLPAGTCAYKLHETDL